MHLEYVGRIVPYRFRRFHSRFARLFGCFWLPCPVCGHEFGGHEWRDVDGLPSVIADPEGDEASGRGICPQCTREGRGWWPEGWWITAEGEA